MNRCRGKYTARHAGAERKVSQRPVVAKRQKREELSTARLGVSVALEPSPFDGTVDGVSRECGADDGVGIKAPCRVGSIDAEAKRVRLCAPGIGVIGLRSFIAAEKTGEEGLVPGIVAAYKKTPCIKTVVWNAVKTPDLAKSPVPRTQRLQRVSTAVRGSECLRFHDGLAVFVVGNRTGFNTLNAPLGDRRGARHQVVELRPGRVPGSARC